MLLNVGIQDRFISETTIGAGTTIREGSVRTDSILVSLFVGSLSSGSLLVEITTLTDEGKEVNVISFPVVSGPTVNLLLRKSATILQRFKITATYTGICTYEVYVRSISSGGEASTKLLGSGNWRVSQKNVGPVSGLLIPAALVDRNGLLVKNWSQTVTIFIAESLGSDTVLVGYPLAPKDALALDIAAGSEVWAISDGGTADIRIVESGA